MEQPADGSCTPEKRPVVLISRIALTRSGDRSPRSIRRLSSRPRYEGVAIHQIQKNLEYTRHREQPLGSRREGTGIEIRTHCKISHFSGCRRDTLDSRLT